LIKENDAVYQYINENNTLNNKGSFIMRFTKLMYLLVSILLSSATYQVFAQASNQDRDRVRQLDRDQQVDLDISRDRDRDRDQDRDRFRDGIGGTIYGGELMTEQERNRYREQLKNAESEGQRNEIRLQNQKKMQSRELNKAQYQDGLGGIIYGARLMTELERNRYREQLKKAESDSQRNEVRLKHQKEMNLREQMNDN
jgi:hypothetical protein